MDKQPNSRMCFVCGIENPIGLHALRVRGPSNPVYYREVEMNKVQLCPRILLVGLALIAVLAVGWTLGARAQDPGQRDAAGPPDKLTAVTAEEESEALRDPGAPQQLEYYKFISANTFVPNDDSMTYNYYDHGCMYRTGGGTWTEHTVQLPQGAVIDYLRVYFYDNDTLNNALAYLAAYDGAGNTAFIATAGSTGTPGQSSAGSGFFEYTVDNSTAAVSVSLSYGNASSDSLRICGVRLHYYYSVATLSLPLVVNQSNP